jgi:hypothetical protein
MGVEGTYRYQSPVPAGVAGAETAGEGLRCQHIFHEHFRSTLPHPQFLTAPSIDPLSEKNIDLSRKNWMPFAPISA